MLDVGVEASPPFLHGFKNLGWLGLYQTWYTWDLQGLAVNLIMILCIIAWSGLISAVTFAVLKCWGALRIDEDTEDAGRLACGALKIHLP